MRRSNRAPACLAVRLVRVISCRLCCGVGRVCMR
nr:MAG TPA: hypothetical protein [Caudoviricetes sp.]